MPNSLHPTDDADAPIAPDLERQRKSARDEASARSAGAQRRYRLNMLDAIDASIRQRQRQNFFRSSRVRVGVGALSVLAASILMLQNKPISPMEWDRALLQATNWISMLRGPSNEAPNENPRSVNSQSETATRPVRADDLLPVPQTPAFAVDTPGGPVMPSPIPGAPLDTLATMVLGQGSGAAPPSSARALSQQAKPVALQAVAPAPVEADAPVIASELESAVADARRKLGSDTKLKQSSASATGVFVDLPKPPVAGSVAAVAEVRSAAAAQAVDSFTLVQAFEGGILVRSGRSVTPYKTGETLPNGKKLISVDPATGTYRAVAPEGSTATQTTQGN